MLEKKYYKVDFSLAKNLWDVHSILGDKLKFFEYYGDLDSLYDSLTNMLCDISIIEIHGMERLKEFNGYDKRVRDVFFDAKHAYDDEFSDRFFVTIVHEDGTREEIK